MLFFRSDDSVFRLAANYVMTLFEDSAHSDSTNTNSETETVPLRPTTMANPRYYSYGSIRQTQTRRQSGPTRNHTVWWHILSTSTLVARKLANRSRMLKQYSSTTNPGLVRLAIMKRDHLIHSLLSW